MAETVALAVFCLTAALGLYGLGVETARAEAVLERRVVEVLSESRQPMTAREIAAEIKRKHDARALYGPLYRTLDRLEEQGRIALAEIRGDCRPAFTVREA